MSEHDIAVLDALKSRRARPRREPPSHRPAHGQPTAPALTAPPEPAPPVEPASPAPKPTVAADPGPEAGPVGALRLAVDDPQANFAVRVRRALDELLSRRLGELRARGVRSSKVEITELLLWELADADANALEARLARFRRHAPR